MPDAVSQQITRLLGTDDWLILHSGHTLVLADELDALELADDVRASEAGDREAHKPSDPEPDECPTCKGGPVCYCTDTGFPVPLEPSVPSTKEKDHA